MAELRVFSVDHIELDAKNFSHAKLPNCGFGVVLTIDKHLIEAAKAEQTRALLENLAEQSYRKFLSQFTIRLQNFENLFAGMIAKNAPAAAVSKQADALQKQLEQEVPEFEKAIERELLEVLKKQTQKKR